ncbi:MAG: hypothetical protein P4L98_01225 [Ancalomicrobiaceae bacterium]|nr:hypothetical protein [Ancalomicrobiaceae bacterium]
MIPEVRLTVLLAALAIAASPAAAATITRVPSQLSGFEFLVISGAITQDDGPAFVDKIASVKSGAVVLDSQGGATVTAIEIGKTIRQKGFATIVPDDTLCASACALIWLAGGPRVASGTAHVGFHAAYVEKNGALVESGAGNALVGAYLNGLGLSQKAIVFVTSAPPEGIEWLNQKNAGTVEIAFTDMGATNNPLRDMMPEKLMAQMTEDEPYDPESATTKFYAALTRADGNGAAAFVIPEKRGMGPFDERNIASFFGSMREHLHVTALSRLDKDTVKVDYSYLYANGRRCSAHATVSTTYEFGRTLIKGIRANC